MGERLRLRACDAEDIQVLASVLQDAVSNAAEMTWAPGDKRFVAIFSRFRWERMAEDAPPPAPDAPQAAPAEGDAPYEDPLPPPFERVNCALCVDKVTAVRRRGVRPGDSSQFLELLTIDMDEAGMTLMFAGGAAIRLETKGVLCHLEDLGEPWPTRWRPSHPDE